MAKKFMYVCLGILALMVAFHLGARCGRADTIVDHAADGIVAIDSCEQLGLFDSGTGIGEAWQYSLSGWARAETYDPPIFLSEIKFWSAHLVVTQAGGCWRRNPSGSWTFIDVPSDLSGVHSGESETVPWGEIKAEFGE